MDEELLIGSRSSISKPARLLTSQYECKGQGPIISTAKQTNPEGWNRTKPRRVWASMNGPSYLHWGDMSKELTAMVPATLRIARCCKEVILALIAAHGYFSLSRSLGTVFCPGFMDNTSLSFHGAWRHFLGVAVCSQRS